MRVLQYKSATQGCLLELQMTGTKIFFNFF
jgi:hypothetical protein